MLTKCFKPVLFQRFGMLSSTWLHSAGAWNMLMAGRKMASLCFLPVYVELARKVSAFGFCSIPIAFTPLVLGGAASAKRRFGLLSKMQTEETVFTFFTVCDGETFGFTTAVEAGSCSSAAHAVKWSGNTHKTVYYGSQGAGPKLNTVFDMLPNKFLKRTLQ